MGSTPSTEEVTMTLELLSQEEQGTTATPTYSSRDEYKIATTPRKEGKPKEAVAISKCLGQIENTFASEQGIPIIKEQVMSTPKFLGQEELGFVSTLMDKEGTTTRKE